ncbi:hypothetical protein [Neptuniibacter sp.]|uniref:hypothetical protein n=1 Tax=Neptuniibacter sp. TaxID=1962643 RepID=UPI00262B106C|nr:hypothetical protein [Neptuniibacter sp.]MCP4598850.1 hypothetical protein [Neptuniibacter sp.]
MDTICWHCTQLIESPIITEPHEQLTALKSRAGATIYRCRSCRTMFEFTDDSIYLLVTNPKSQRVAEARCA